MKCYCPEVNGESAYSFFTDHMHTCMYNYLDIIAYVFGLLNILFWCFAQFPQIWKTFRTKKPDSLSLTFLAMWLTGDITNLVGCLLTQQTQIQLFTSIYFVSMDIILLSQYFWYVVICKKKYRSKTIDGAYAQIDSDNTSESDDSNVKSNGSYQRSESCNINSPTFEENAEIINIECDTSNKVTIQDSSTHYLPILILILGISLAKKITTKTDEAEDICGEIEVSQTERIIGDGCAWISGMLYFGGRIPQIIHNYRYKNVEGMAIALFIMSILANTFYSLSVLFSGIDITDPSFYEAKLAYLVGSTMVIPLSTTIVYQYFFYTYIKKWIEDRKKEEPEI
ncbi:Uncharacterized protein QTN25_010707 [Entamoeba marina]